MTETEKNEWQRCVEFHGHACPGLAIGFRACEAAQAQLQLAFSPDEELVCVTENDACGVDAVQLLTGCTMGKGNLIYRRVGKMAFSFFRRSTGGQCRVVFKLPMGQAGMDRAAFQEYLLKAPLAELFTIQEPNYPLPTPARLFARILCSQCGEGMAENLARLRDGQPVCRDCQPEYSRGW